MREAIVVKRVGGLYELLDKEGNRHRVKSRGRLKSRGILIGDWVEFSDDEMIEDVFKRKNSLTRPPLANVDQQILVFTIESPPLHRDLLEKMLLQGEIEGIENVIVIQKKDLVEDQVTERLAEEYLLAGYSTYTTSAVLKLGLEDLKTRLKGRISVFAGPSGVGKSSLLNALYDEYDLETGELSEKIQRGRHTTRHTQLYGDWERGLVADTPGFYRLETPFVEPRDLASYFPEMRPVLGDCRFVSCLHENEPECAIRELSLEGKISENRYQVYLKFLEEMKEYKRGQYL